MLMKLSNSMLPWVRVRVALGEVRGLGYVTNLGEVRGLGYVTNLGEPDVARGDVGPLRVRMRLGDA